MLSIDDVRGIVTKALMEAFGSRVVAAVLFGSVARCEVSERSDIDLFVVVDDLHKDPIERRLVIYRALSSVRAGLKRDTSIIDADVKDLAEGELTSLLINIAWDGVVLYDKDGYVTRLLKRIKDTIGEAKLIRYRTRDGKYGWKPSKPSRITLRV